MRRSLRTLLATKRLCDSIGGLVIRCVDRVIGDGGIVVAQCHICTHVTEATLLVIMRNELTLAILNVPPQ